MSGAIWNLLSFVVALGILVTVHEFGHFWVARKNGVLVKRFSIGFGKALIRWRDRQGTEFVIAAIPLGGYVRMLDERVDPVLPQFKDLTFNSKTVWQRMAIIAAGPAANFIFAFFALWLMYMLGVQTIKPVIATVTPQSIAAQAKVPNNSQIVSVNGHTATDANNVNLLLVEQLGRNRIELGLKDFATGQARTIVLDTTDWKFNPEQQSVFASLGLELDRPQALTELALIAEDSAAQRDGLQLNDKILQIDEQVITSWPQVVKIVSNSPEQPLLMVIERNNRQLELTVTPASVEAKDGFSQGMMLGVSPKVTPWPEGIVYTQRYGPLEAIGAGFNHSWQLIRLSFSMLVKLVTGDVSMKHLSGPISIAQGAGTTASIGFVAFLSFLALISVNLGVINLLPLPILDGGHLMYMLVELIRGKPVSEKAQEVGFRFGALLLLMLMGIALLNDISRL
ncbi:sigma E protease regulator RseP [Rheinheimera sp. MMS21-TC3]|uniref:sigma E protease regulator RseP n=1 Tax=Rheinheimera sp. MMS21-TC3 TaxID=3072790 RepID=UPI0028C3CFA0|nr:sigma E protease regulator RseP [Rheinheimera sp. MMS21-TC3]WNO62002.1 sigma E protease regulator RseP [Rheinheimera sp. MMS21-TC3]